MATRRRMPPGELADALVHHRVETDEREHASHLVVAGPPFGPLLEDRDVVDEVEGGELLMEARLLWHVPEAAADLEATGGRRRIQAEDANVARVGRQHRGDDPQQRGLARRRSGPSRPVTPALDVEVDPPRATVAPKRFVSPAT